MNRPVRITMVPANQSANAIALSQTPGGAGNLTLNGALVASGVATMPQARRVAIASAANDSGKTFTITGTDRNGLAMSEVVTGPNTTTVYSVNDFLTVSQIAVSAATAGAITVGTGGVISSQWVPLDRNRAFNLGFGIKVSGAINYTIEHTFDDVHSYGIGPQPNTGIPAPSFTAYAHPTIFTKTANDNGYYSGQPITAVRVTINSYTNGATLELNLAPGQMEN